MATNREVIGAHEKVQLRLFKEALKDIRYILKTYRKPYPDEAWETIEKIARNPKLNLKNIKQEV